VNAGERGGRDRGAAEPGGGNLEAARERPPGGRQAEFEAGAEWIELISGKKPMHSEAW